MISKSVEETAKIAQDIATALKPKASGATIVALSGDLGSGKTTFTKAFAREFGVPEDDITSPTFVIMKGYDVDTNGFKRLIHIDAYRLEKPEEARQIGWEGLVADPSTVILIEWPEHLGGAVPNDARQISFKFLDDTTREISI
jgi:tRNA threonylcarbamoyl adenosine modification protein YjeE